MNAEVMDYAEERSRRAVASDIELESDMEADVSEEMRAALAAASALPEPAISPLMVQWLRFRDRFAEAMEGGLYTIDDLDRMVFAGEAYFWPGRDAALVAKREVYPSGEAVMQTLWAVGDIEEVLSLAPGMEATARLIGCSSVLVEGRAGWARVLKTHGYEPWSVTVRKVL